MTAIEIRTAAPGIAALVAALWQGEISQADFIKDAHQIGVSVARIEWEIEQLKDADGIS